MIKSFGGISENNLFQYPTEKMIENIAQVCLNCFDKANNQELIDIIVNDRRSYTCLPILDDELLQTGLGINDYGDW